MFETVTELRERLGEVVAGFDPALVDGAGAARLVEEFAAIERLAGAGRVLAARRVAESGAWKRDGDRSAAHWMARKTGTSVGAAVGTLETARRLEELPATEDALRTGLLSGPQAEEIASAAAADPDAEDQLLDAAATEGLVGLRERCRRVRAAACADEAARHRAIHASRYLRHREADGAFRMELRSTVDVGGEILAALEPYRERIFAQARTAGWRDPYEAYGADALVALARSAANGATEPDGSGPRATVHVRVDHTALVRGHVETGETCEIPGVGPVPVATARAMAADAIVYGILTTGVEVTRVAHLGRRPTAAQRRALEARDPTCVVPGCEARDHLEIDHVTGWALTRITKLDDLARLCSWHHHLKTHCGYRLEGPPGHWTWHGHRDTGYAARPPPGATLPYAGSSGGGQEMPARASTAQ